MDVMAMKKSQQRTVPEHTTALGCSRCAEKVETVRMYMSYESSLLRPSGFWPQLSIRLCKECLNEGLKVLV